MIVTIHRIVKGEHVERILPNVASITFGTSDCLVTFSDRKTMALQRSELMRVDTQTETVIIKD